MLDFYSLRTVRWDRGSIILIDQTKLPDRVKFLACKKVSDVANAIKKMKVRGAPAIGVAASMGLALEATRNRFKDRDYFLATLRKSADMLGKTRPTAYNLHWGIKRMMMKAEALEGKPDRVADELVKEAQLIADEDVEACRRIGQHGAPILDDGDTVLTHCN